MLKSHRKHTGIDVYFRACRQRTGKRVIYEKIVLPGDGGKFDQAPDFTQGTFGINMKIFEPDGRIF
jgi:hypothetical protein